MVKSKMQIKESIQTTRKQEKSKSTSTTKKKKTVKKNDSTLKIQELQQKIKQLEAELTTEQNKVANLKLYFVAEQKKVIVLENHLLEERKSNQLKVVTKNNEDKSNNTPTKRTTLKPNKKKRIIANQKNKCHFCSEDLLTETTTIDHIIALKYGGGNDDRNLQALCNECHKEKSSIEIKYESLVRDLKFCLPMVRQLLSP